MSNANRDYAIVYDIKNSSLVLSRPLNFYITDKNTSNIFIKLVTRVIVGNGIDQYTDIENASNYVLTMRVIKPNNKVKSLEATQQEPENIFQFDLTEDFKDIPGKYICELTISTIVSSRQELITSDPFIYEVKRSILSNVGEIIETEDTTVEKLLNNLDATKAELSSQIKDKATKLEVNSMLNDISVSQINKNKGLIDQSYLAESLLQQIVGNAPVNAIPEDLSITTRKIAEKAITPNKLSNSLCKDIENINISYDFTDTSIPLPGINNGATYDSFSKTLLIPEGNTGNESFLRYNYTIKKADHMRIRIFFKFRTSINLENIAQLSMNVAIVSNNETYPNKRDKDPMIINLGDDYYVYYIDFTNTFAGEIEIRPFLQITNSDTNSEKFIKMEKCYYTLTPTDIYDFGNDLILENVISDKFYKEIKIYEQQTTNLDILVDTSTYEHLYIDVKSIYDTSLKIYGYINGDYETKPMKMINMKSGNLSHCATTVGIYKIDLKKYDRIKFTNIQSSVNAPITVTAYWKPFDDVIRQNLKPCSRDAFNPNLSNAIKRPYMLPQAFKNNTIYTINTANYTEIKKSNDYGENTISCYEFDQRVKNFLILNNGNCVAILEDNCVYVSDDNFGTFTKKLDLGTKPPHTLFGLNEYNQYVLITEYATMGSGDPGKKVYLSKDYGVTFNEIFNLDNFGFASGYHVHSASYDPYENLIWVCSGDGLIDQMIFYSNDLGLTWYKAAEIGKAPTQATIIIPLKDCVLFGSDSRLVSVTRYNRPANGTEIGSTLDFETAIIFEEEWGKNGSTEVPIATTPCIDYENSRAYFGYAIIADADHGSKSGKLKYGEVWATNGYDFKEVYKEGSIVGDGVFGVWGDFNSSNMIVSRVVDERENLVVIDIKDTWI